MEATAPTFFVAAGAELTLTDLPTDALGLVLYQLTLAHDIARVGLTNRALKAAALAALKLRPFSGEVVTLAGHGEVSNPHAGQVHSVIATPDSRLISSSMWHIKLWRDGVCERTIGPMADHTQAGHTCVFTATALLPGGARFVSVAIDCAATTRSTRAPRTASRCATASGAAGPPAPEAPRRAARGATSPRPWGARAIWAGRAWPEATVRRTGSCEDDAVKCACSRSRRRAPTTSSAASSSSL